MCTYNGGPLIGLIKSIDTVCKQEFYAYNLLCRFYLQRLDVSTKELN